MRVVDDLPFRSFDELIAFLYLAQATLAECLWDINFPLALCARLHAEQWSHLRQLGLETVTFGIESGDEQLRRKLGKQASDADVMRAVLGAINAGINVKTYFIVGTPGESRSQTLGTIALAERVVGIHSATAQARCSVFAYKPMPGSALWSMLLSQGFTETELLAFADFHLSATRQQKSAWRSKFQWGEVAPLAIEELIADYYERVEPLIDYP